MRALRLITCGSVDDGKSTLIGRMLWDSNALPHDLRARVNADGHPNLAALTDGLQAEREQGITIDVAWRYFHAPGRTFIVGDCPGHEQYTRNMVTAASQAEAALVLVDATKLEPTHNNVHLLPQTRRHTLLLQLLRVPEVVFAVNKLDAVPDPAQAFAAIGQAVRALAKQADLPRHTVLPVSALCGQNVVHRAAGWAGYQGPSLLEWLTSLSVTTDAPAPTVAEALGAHFSVQWVQAHGHATHTHMARRVLWGTNRAYPLALGDRVSTWPSGQQATVAQVLDPTQALVSQLPGASDGGVVLDRELDVSRGDWLLGQPPADSRQARATLAWLDDEPLRVGHAYWARHGHRWVKARVSAVHHQRNLNNLQPQPTDTLGMNAIGEVTVQLQQALPLQPYATDRTLGSLLLVDPASHASAGALLVGQVV
jgi:sulfate adenylyltransferase subunit 1